MELIFKKVNGVAWEAGEWIFTNMKAGDVAKHMKENHPQFRIGFRAIDLGPAVAYECARQGYGEILWMK